MPERRRKILTAILVVGLPLSLCMAFVLLGLNAAPRLLIGVLNLERVESFEGVLPPPLAPLMLDAPSLDQVELLLPTWLTAPLRLDGTTDGVTALGRTAMVNAGAYESQAQGQSTYLFTLSETRLNELWRREGLPESTASRFRDLTVDLQPGGLVLYADVNLGLRWRRMGVLLTQEAAGLDLHLEAIVLDETFYALPDERTLVRSLLPVDLHVERAMRDLAIVGPLPGEAGVEAVRFHSDRLTLLAHDDYEAPSLPDTGWQALEAGVEYRELDVSAESSDPQEQHVERLRILRLDPSQVHFRVRYNPSEPRSVLAWAETTSALLVVNGGYFAPENERGKETLGLLISGGQRYGEPFGDFAGMFAVTADQQVSVRWLRERSYNPAEPLSEALVSFPVLVKPGGEMGFPADADDGATARRTVVAQDCAGNVLLIVAPRGTLSLHALAVFLARPDLALDIDVALNLDGGSSTGLWLNAGVVELKLDSHTTVPSIITVERR